MVDDNYFDKFLDDEDLPLEEPKVEVILDWLSHKNSSYAAYQAILSLQLEKQVFIKQHKLKSQYMKKSNYLIQKSEVARLVDKKAQPLFNSNSYSKHLLDFFNVTNDNLEKSKIRRINTSSSGVRNKRKEDLVVEHKALLKSHKKSQSQIVDDVYQRLIDNMPLDVKRKLKVM